jgi:hypothetical protein
VPDLRLDQKRIQKQVLTRLAKYKGLNVLEQYAVFMGSAQLLELALKQLLVRLYGHNLERIGKWTLGRTTAELKGKGLRKDFIALLESVVNYRNHIAHEVLANDAILKSLAGDSGRLEVRNLERGIYELEQLMFLHDWCEEHDAWR